MVIYIYYKCTKNSADKIDIPIRNLDDATIIQIMANENMTDWQTSPPVVIETIRVARDFLNAELAKYATWEEFSSGEKAQTNLLDIQIEPAFRRLKGSGVGHGTIEKFLGDNWSESTIKEALHLLDLIKKNVIDEVAVKRHEKITKAAQFA
jgi:hypothetical protein